MLLQKLTEFARDRLELPPEMYIKRSIRWLVKLERTGELNGIIQLSDGKGGKQDRGKQMTAPHMQRTGGKLAPKLLADNGEYVFGIPKDYSKESEEKREKSLSKVVRRHKSFVLLHRRCLKETMLPDIKAITSFLRNVKPENLKLPDGFDAGDDIVFEVDGQQPMDNPRIQGWWATFVNTCASKKKVMRGTCMICGSEASLIDREPVKFKRIPSAQKQFAMNCANEKAFESYGLENAFTAPTCRPCAELYVKAANSLMNDETGKTHLTIGPLAYLFWTRKEEDIGFMSMLDRPDSETVHRLITGPRSGVYDVNVLPNEFYATSWSASGARIAVRDWLETTVDEAKHQVANWFRWQRLVNLWTNEIGEPLPRA